MYFLAFLFLSCSDDRSQADIPLSAVIFHSINEKQVAFTALACGAVSREWDFGDGSASLENNFVHELLLKNKLFHPN